MEHKVNNIRRKEKENGRTVALTPYQLSQILNFASDKSQEAPGSIFGGLLGDKERAILTEAVAGILMEGLSSLSFSPQQNILPAIVSQRNLPKGLADKINGFCQIHLISEKTVADLGVDLSKFPLPVVLTWKSIENIEKGLRDQVIEFLRKGGIISVFSFKKPPESLSAEELEQEITHQFISVNLIPPASPTSEEEVMFFNFLNRKVNQRLDDDYENGYRAYLLTEKLLKTHMEQVKLSLMATAGLAGFFYFIDQLAKGKISPELYYGFQTLVKIITHLTANFVDFYSQYKMFLWGNNFFQQAEDLIKKFGLREYLIFVFGAILDSLSEWAGMINNFFGASVFGLESMFGTAFTTIVASSRHPNNTPENNGFKNNIKTLIEDNPAILSKNIAAFLTLLTSVGVLGFAHLFHNPLAVVFVGGVSEPLASALLTEIFMRRDLAKKRKELIEKN